MALFGRKKEEDYEDEDEILEQEDGHDRRLSRRFKDLKSENRKKRKEPPKPWGKRERILVLAILASTVVISGVLALIANGKGLSGLNFNFKKPHFSFDIFKEKTIILEK